MSAAHTPVFEPRYGEMEIIEAGGKFIIRQKGNGAYFASTYSRVDARLIAAAPELLAALRRLMDCPDLCLDTLDAESDAAIDAARAAIAKATEGASRWPREAELRKEAAELESARGRKAEGRA